ncbi:hypothetical protein GCM10027615_79490 [Plantactinospora veratri]
MDAGPAIWPDVTVTRGKEVIELSVIPTNKGTALEQLRTQLSASAALFLGDDVTDENAFAKLHGPDVGIKIGPGETRATFRIDEPVDAARVLALLLEVRRNWLFGERAVPIERHSMLANGRTVALVTPEASLSWLCHPKPDSPAIFADLVGGNPAGYFSIAPERGGLPLGQRYRTGTMTVETRWSGLTVTDWLDRPSTDGVPTGSAVISGDSTLVRVLSGAGRVRLDFAPAPSSARSPCSSSRSATGCWCSAPTSRSRSTPPASSGRSSTTAATRPPARWSTWPPPVARSPASCGSARTAWTTTGYRCRSGRRWRSSRGGTGSPGSGCPAPPGTWSGGAR